MNDLVLDLEPFEIDVEDDELSDEQTGCCSVCRSELEINELGANSDELKWEEEMRRGSRRFSRPAGRRLRSVRRFRPSIRRPRRLATHLPKHSKHPSIRRPRSRRPVIGRAPSEPCICPAHGTEFVRWVQSTLNQVLGLQLRVNGVMNRATRDAVRRLQEQEGLSVDGIAGPETERLLIESRRKKFEGSSNLKFPKSIGNVEQLLTLDKESWEDEKEEEFRVSKLPIQVRQAFKEALSFPLQWPNVVQKAIDTGIVNLTTLADIPFFLNHRDRLSGIDMIGRPIRNSESNFRSLSEEWLWYRDAVKNILEQKREPDPPIESPPQKLQGFTTKDAEALALIIIGERSREKEVLQDLWLAVQQAGSGILALMKAYISGIRKEFESSGEDTKRAYIGAAYALMDKANGKQRRLESATKGFRYGYASTSRLIEQLNFDPVIGYNLDIIFRRIRGEGQPSSIITTIYQTLLKASSPFPTQKVNIRVRTAGWCRLSYPNISVNQCGPTPF